MEKLQSTLNRIVPTDKNKEEEAQRYIDGLTKPVGSLGVLEDIARQMAGITGQVKPQIPKKTSILMAGDHGVVAEGVSAYPQEVTPQMVLNFLSGGAAMNVLARHANAELIVVDMGVAVDLPEHPILLNRKVAYGTANMAQGPAMTREQAIAALEAGIEVAESYIATGTGLFGTGEMGIGNTTPSAAITAFYKGCSVAEVCGRGTGLDDQGLQLKIKVIEQAIAVNKPDPDDALDVLAKLGGYEIAGMAGVMLAAAANRVPVMVDGFISAVSAIIASRLHPHAVEYMLASHLSEEPGHITALSLLELTPFLRMNMRLGEGTGTALAMSMVDAALKIVHEMASFADAGISGAL
ncbi:MAG TPA: nicotinate-nucleotide--dimethylbenzimidazole phosphoribosyltransferase [Oscillospiraceae bacterium]|nr:nicotinate-nucleotide--dimethylbenzimidazole phosphoribosyltransferase [Oscillospiraceae bacterium]